MYEIYKKRAQRLYLRKLQAERQGLLQTVENWLDKANFLVTLLKVDISL